MLEANEFEANGVNVFLTAENVRDIHNNQSLVEGSPLLESECPVVATGFFTSDGIWRFYATHHEETDYKLEYDEFITALHETRE